MSQGPVCTPPYSVRISIIQISPAGPNNCWIIADNHRLKYRWQVLPGVLHAERGLGERLTAGRAAAVRLKLDPKTKQMAKML